MKLGILDQSIIHHNQTSQQAIEETVKTIKLAERLGYHRFWVSEHHNSLIIAGTSPEILIANLATQTAHIRIGSGGVMLPNHSEFKVAENFRMLETLYPGRIDLGIGRAPGGDRVTASILNPSNQFLEKDYLRQLEYLQHFFNDTAGTKQGRIIAMPQSLNAPEQWMLSSSGGSSSNAAKFGMGLGVAKFINGNVNPSIVETYKREFIPSEQFEKHKVILAVMVLCGETQEIANQMLKYVNFVFLQMAKGNFNMMYDINTVMNYEFTGIDMQIIRNNSGRIVSGTKNEVKKQLDDLVDAFEADEIMTTNMAGQLEYRLKSFELLAEIYN